jgi:hypothetical protein
MGDEVIQRPTMYLYACRACQREWKQENYFSKETCVYCGATDTICIGCETTEYVAYYPDPEPQMLWWSKDAKLDEWPKMRCMPKWMFAIRHPKMFWRVFVRKEGRVHGR